MTDVISWRCQFQSCAARVKTTTDYQLIQPSDDIEHNHDLNKRPVFDVHALQTPVKISAPRQPEIFVFSSKFGNGKIKVGNFTFYRRRATPDCVTWECEKCKATCITTHRLEIVYLADENDHDHAGVSFLSMARNVVKHQVKTSATEKPTEKPVKLMHAAYEGMERLISDQDLKQMRKTINRQRLKTRPPLPRNLADTFESLRNIQEKNENMDLDTDLAFPNLTIHIDDDESLAMLYTAESLRALCDQDRARPNIQLADGTFKYSPKYFEQVYTIHTTDRNKNMPGVYFLLKRKDTPTYLKMFRELISKCDQLGHPLDIRKFVLDFEPAVLNACKFFFPNVSHRFCQFHYGQAVSKKLRGCRQMLTRSDYNNLRMCISLSSLPTGSVYESFKEIKALLRGQAKGFIKYMETTYITPRSKFQPEFWAGCITAEEGHTTSNICESFHTHFARLFGNGNYHPNIYTFIDNLNIHHKFFTMTAVPRPPHKNTQLLQDYQDNKINVIDFLKAVLESNKKTKKTTSRTPLPPAPQHGYSLRPRNRR